jgi:hypothetical protein
MLPLLFIVRTVGTTVERKKQKLHGTKNVYLSLKSRNSCGVLRKITNIYISSATTDTENKKKRKAGKPHVDRKIFVKKES